MSDMSSDKLDGCLPKPKKPCLDREFRPGFVATTSSVRDNAARASSHVTQDELDAVKIIERIEADYKMALELDRQWNRPEGQRKRKSFGSPSCAGPSSARLNASLTSLNASCSSNSTLGSPIPLAQHVLTDAPSLVSTPMPTENIFITTESETSTTSSHTTTMVTTDLPSWWTKCSLCSPESLLHKPYHLIHLSLADDPDNEQLVDTLTTQKIIYSFIKCGLQAVKIWRIQNPTLWRRYDAEKACMIVERGKEYNLNEELLFHTSRSPTATICAEGLDMRVSRTGCFGKGIYFRYYISPALALYFPHTVTHQPSAIAITTNKVKDY